MSVDLSKYNTAAKICGNVYNLLKKEILENHITNIKQLYDLGMNEINVQCKSCYKNVIRKGVAYPISISLNNNIEHFTYNPVDLNLSIQKYDIVKIKLGVDIDGSIAMYSNTFIYDDGNDENKDNYITFLNKLKNDVVKQMFAGNTNDEVRILIESKCTDYQCFPIMNCKSFEHMDNQIYNDNGKYMILNYKKVYDSNEYLIQDNECFEFLENEIYTVNINVIDDSDDEEHKISIDENNSLLYRFNDNYYGFKLKASHALYSTITKKHGYNVFNMNDNVNDIKLKLGMKECLNNHVLEWLPATFVNKNVYSITFTVCIREKDGLMLKYF